MGLLFIVYLIAGYWAVGVMLFENKVVIYSFGGLFMQKNDIGDDFGRYFDSGCNN